MAIFHRKKKDQKNDSVSSRTSSQSGTPAEQAKRNVSNASQTSSGGPYERFKPGTPPATEGDRGLNNSTTSNNSSEAATNNSIPSGPNSNSGTAPSAVGTSSPKNPSRSASQNAANSQQLQQPTAMRPPQTSQPSQYPWSKHYISNASPFPRYGHAANYIAARDGEVFVMGGLKGSNVFGDLWVIESDTLTGYLLDTEGCPSPRVGHASLTLGNAFIVFGGDTKIEEADELDDNLYLLNTTTLKWTVANPSGPRPSGRYGHSISTIGSKVYIFGGQLDDYFFDDLVSYDLTKLRDPSSKWELIESSTPAPPPRTNHSVVTYKDKLYLFGGTDGRLWYSDTWVFDPADHSWIQLDCSGFLPAPCEGHAATIVGDIMYVFGGRSAQGEDLATLSALKLSTRKWFTFQNLGPGPSPRAGHSMTAFSGHNILVMGGESLESDEEYDGNKQSAVFVLDTARITYPIEKPSSQATDSTTIGKKVAAPALAAGGPTGPPRVSSPFSNQTTNKPHGDSSLGSGAPRSGSSLGSPSGPAVQQPGLRNSNQRVASPMSLATGGSPRNVSNGRTQSPLIPQQKPHFDGPFTPLSGNNNNFTDNVGSHAAAAGAALAAAGGTMVGASKKRISPVGYGQKFASKDNGDSFPDGTAKTLGPPIETSVRDSARENSIINSYDDDIENKSTTTYESVEDDTSRDYSKATNESLEKEAISTPERRNNESFASRNISKDENSPTTPTIPTYDTGSKGQQAAVTTDESPVYVHTMPGAWNSESASSTGSFQSPSQVPTTGLSNDIPVSDLRSTGSTAYVDNEEPVVLGSRRVERQGDYSETSSDTANGSSHGFEKPAIVGAAAAGIASLAVAAGFSKHKSEDKPDTSVDGQVPTTNGHKSEATPSVAQSSDLNASKGSKKTARDEFSLGATHDSDRTNDSFGRANFSNRSTDTGSFSGNGNGVHIASTESNDPDLSNSSKSQRPVGSDGVRNSGNAEIISSATYNSNKFNKGADLSKKSTSAPSPKHANEDGFANEEVNSVNEALEKLKASNSWYETELAAARDQGYIPSSRAPVDVLKLRRVSQRITQDTSASLSERDILVAALAELKEELQHVQANVKTEMEAASQKITAAERERDYYKSLSNGDDTVGAVENSREIGLAGNVNSGDYTALERRARDQADKLILVEHERAKLRSELDRLISRNKEIEATTNDHVSALAAAGAAAAASKAHIDDLSRHVDAHTQKISELQAENRTLKSNLLELQDELENTRAEAARHKDLADHHYNRAIQSDAALSSGINNIVTHWSVRKEYYDKSLNEPAAGASDKDLETILSNVREEHSAETEKHKAALQEALAEINELKEKISTTDSERSQLLEERANLEQSLGNAKSDLEQHSLQLEAHQSKFRELSDEHNALRDKYSSESSEKADYQRQLTLINEEHNAKYQELEADYNKSLQYFKNQEMALSKTREELSRYKEQNSRLQSKLDDMLLQEKDVSADISNNSVSSDYGTKMNQRHLDLQLRDLRAQVIILQEERDELKSKSLELRKAQINHSADLEYAQSEIQRLTAENRKLSQAVSSASGVSKDSTTDPSTGFSLDSFSNELEQLRIDRERSKE